MQVSYCFCPGYLVSEGACKGSYIEINSGNLVIFLSAAIRVYRKMGDVAMVQSLESIEVNPFIFWGIQLRHYFGKQTEKSV